MTILKTAALAALLLCANPTWAQMRVPGFDLCWQRAEDIERLTAKYEEVIAMRGLAGIQGKAVGELWVNRQTGTWTFLIRHADGAVCHKASGLSVEVMTLPPIGDPT